MEARLRPHLHQGGLGGRPSHGISGGQTGHRPPGLASLIAQPAKPRPPLPARPACATTRPARTATQLSSITFRNHGPSRLWHQDHDLVQERREARCQRRSRTRLDQLAGPAHRHLYRVRPSRCLRRGATGPAPGHPHQPPAARAVHPHRHAGCHRALNCRDAVTVSFSHVVCPERVLSDTSMRKSRLVSSGVTPLKLQSPSKRDTRKQP